jgi:hypothetical protein
LFDKSKLQNFDNFTISVLNKAISIFAQKKEYYWYIIRKLIPIKINNKIYFNKIKQRFVSSYKFHKINFTIKYGKYSIRMHTF